MIGPLPVLHRIVVVVGALVVWIGLGAWSGVVPWVPLTLWPGTVLGAVAGVASAYALLHDFDRGSSTSLDRGRRRLH